MQCIHINIRQAVFILLLFLANHIRTADNQNSSLVINEIKKTNTTEEILNKDIKKSSDTALTCPVSVNCNKLPIHCITCNLTVNCIYGEELVTKCHRKDELTCQDDSDQIAKIFEKKYLCRYCYQTESWEHKCLSKFTCGSVESPRNTYITNCTTNDDIICLGHREFMKKVKCNWTAGYKWSTALFLSITVGGFGADRFYLGHWQEGIGKFFSFGGLGVWTIVDVILISLHYLGPADGSLYL